MILNSKYFTSIAGGGRDGTEYGAYEPRYRSMILVSDNQGKDRIPLAAISLKCSSDHDSKAVIAPRHNTTHADFQGLINEDNQEFKFIITNLCPDGKIKIDIMKTNVAVDCTDPGAELGAVNQVNELHEYQSYSVKVDQMTGKTMILSSITTDNNEKLTVNAAEILTPHKPKGTYYYIAVTPKADCDSVIAKFQSTKWISCNMFCIQNKVHIDYPRSSNQSYFGIPTIKGMSYRSQSDDEMCLNLASLGSMSNNSHDSINMVIEKSISSSNNLQVDVNDKIISSSFASDVKEGRNKQVFSNRTGYTYVYDVPSNQTGKLCTLSLSVSDKLKFYEQQPDNEKAKEAKELIESYITTVNNKLINKMDIIYKEDSCVICLESNVNTIFYECGHSCTHYDCVGTITKCPMCRRHISAVVDIR